MKKFSLHSQRPQESYQWVWYISEKSIQLSPLFIKRYTGHNPTERWTVTQWLALFREPGRDTIKQVIDSFQQGDQDHLLFTGELISDSHNAIHVTVLGEALTFTDGKPALVSGELTINPADQSPGPSHLDDSSLLNLIMEKLPYSIFFKDRESRFIRISRECTTKFGISQPEEAVGKTDFDFFEEEHARDALKDEQNIIRTGKRIEDKLEREVLPGNPPKVQWASTTKLPLYNEKNKIIGTFGITNNVTEQFETERALKESEKKYRSIFENIQDVYYRTNREGIVTEISPSIETYSGYSREEVIGHPVADFYYFQKDREKLIAQLKVSGEVSDFEIRMANKQNILMYTSVSAKVVRDENGQIIAVEGIMRDITERKSAELELKETHNFFDQILNNTSEGIYVVNSDFKYIYWNSMMETISGMKQSEVIGKKPYELFTHVNHEKLANKFKKALAGQTTKSSDYYYEIKSTGKKGWAQAYYTPLHTKTGEIENVLVAISDITDRKQAEQKLRKSDDTLNKLSQQVPGAIYQFQQYPDGRSRFPFASDAFYSIYEINPEDMRRNADKAIERIHPDDLDSVHQTIRESFLSLNPWELDYRVQLPERGTRWIRGRARPEKQDDDSVIWHGYLFDITDKKRRENELRETMDIVGDQNSRLMNFAHIVSHNLRNHAGNISSLLSLYESEESEQEKSQLLEYLGMASSRLNEAIRDLNEIIDKQSGSSKNVSLVNVYEYVLKIKEILSTDITVQNVQFDLNIPKDITVEYNPAYLESILLNLISNAIKYRHPQRQPVISISFENSGNVPVLTVKDNGLGIDLKKHNNKLFGMYNTFHGNEDAKGIGLYITKNQVESMGGSIEVESSPGKGTMFKIRLNCDLARVEREAR